MARAGPFLILSSCAPVACAKEAPSDDGFRPPVVELAKFCAQPEIKTPEETIAVSPIPLRKSRRETLTPIAFMFASSLGLAGSRQGESRLNDSTPSYRRALSPAISRPGALLTVCSPRKYKALA